MQNLVNILILKYDVEKIMHVDKGKKINLILIDIKSAFD